MDAGTAGVVLQSRPALLQGIEGAGDGRLQRLAGRRETKSGAGLLEQGQAGLLLQGAQLARHRAVGAAQFLGGPRHGTEAGRRLEGAQGGERRQATGHRCNPIVSSAHGLASSTAFSPPINGL